jgi:glycogen operon protein
VEGPSADPHVEAVRTRQVKNVLATLLLSLGTPMLLGGDEMRRTQRGNNNAWCQNNDVSWYDWRLLHQHAGVHRFCRELIAFRLRHPAFLRPEFYNGRDSSHNRIPDITWLTASGDAADWDPEERTLALLIDGNKSEIDADRDDNDILMLLNALDREVLFTLAPVPQGKEAWYRALDTALPPPRDIVAPGAEERVERESRLLAARSLVVLLSR